ncbi:MAG TPA: Crp/Fnr family transcriptional regulator [Gemmatimonadaceae bacterium]|nr:Crp/Fnr family transcriptional regulator [Gemmatimonadaceae bacterium]
MPIPSIRTPAVESGIPALSGNALLDGLPSNELDPILSAAERVRPRMRQVLIEQSSEMPYAYFPLNGVFSLLAEMSDRTIVETLVVGREGMVGLPAIFGASNSPTRVICQISGWTLRIPTTVLLDMTPRDGVLFDRLLRYAQVRMTALSRSVACNGLHSAQQRYARWVLTTQDRVSMDEFPITQDFLAQMLGVTRPTISLVGQDLQALGLIHYAQGRLTVDDRSGLERIACECYGAIREAFEKLPGVSWGKQQA